jgi:ABC-type nickel/cobalt efflux system permease component RcnA
MSVSTASVETHRELTRTGLRLLVAAIAVGLVLAGLALLAWLVGAAATAPPPPKSPFGTGLREAAPAAGGIGGIILAVQAQFYKALTDAVAALKADGAAVWSLVVIGFVYGVFHAAGPGHGKGVISAYLLASRRTLVKGLGLSAAAALLQALVAIALVAVMRLVLNATAAGTDLTAAWIERISFMVIAGFGAVLLWRKTAGLVGGHAAHAHTHHDHAHDDHGHHDHAHHDHAHHDHAHAGHVQEHVHDEHCGHVHIPPPAALDRMTAWRDMAAVVVAAGIRPCSGAIILLVFALSQGLFAAGIVATFAMAAGTAITTGALATVAVLAKGLAVRLAGESTGGARAVAALEVLAAAFVLVLGAVLLVGLWSPTSGS